MNNPQQPSSPLSHPHRFPKRQRITSQKLVDDLFTPGAARSLVAFPLRVVFAVKSPSATAPSAPSLVSSSACVPGASAAGVQLLVSVPKRRLRHAVDRNRAKRQVREAFRLQRGPLLAALPDGHALVMAVVWLSDTPQSSAFVASRLARLMARVAHALSAGTSSPSSPPSPSSPSSPSPSAHEPAP